MGGGKHQQEVLCLLGPTFLLQNLKKDQISRSTSNTRCRATQCSSLCFLQFCHDPTQCLRYSQKLYSGSHCCFSWQWRMLHLTGLLSPPWSAGYHSSCWWQKQGIFPCNTTLSPPPVSSCCLLTNWAQQASFNRWGSAEFARHILGLYPQPAHESSRRKEEKMAKVRWGSVPGGSRVGRGLHGSQNGNDMDEW